MKNRLPLLGALCLLVPSLAFGQDFEGRYALEGRYSNRRGTAADLRIEATHEGFRVERTGRYTSRRHRTKPPFTWRSSDVEQRGNVLLVTFVVSADQGNAAGVSDSLLNALGGVSDSASGNDVAALLSDHNVFKAAYLRGSNGRLREYVANLTRKGDEAWWRFISTRGERAVTPAIEGKVLEAEYGEVDPFVIGDAFVAVIEEAGTGRKIGIWTPDVPPAFDDGFYLEDHIGWSIRIDMDDLTPVTDPDELAELSYISSTDAFYRLDGNPVVTRPPPASLPAVVRGEITEVFIGEMDPFVVGDVAVLWVVEDGTNRKIGVVTDFDTTDPTFDDMNVGKRVRIDASSLEAMDNPAAVDELNDYEEADYFELVGSVTLE